MAKMQIHPSITSERIMEAIEQSEICLDNPGFCLACGEDAEGCEPDAQNYECECCGRPSVFGAEQIALMMPL